MTTTKSEEQNTAGADSKAVPEPEPIDSVWKACAYGDLDKLRQFIEADPTSGNTPDEQVSNGYCQSGVVHDCSVCRVTIRFNGQP